MILIAAVEDRMGMSFNNRRVSRDRTVTERILKFCEGGRLFISPDSSPLFTENASGTEIAADPDFLTNAGGGDFCFVENVPPAPFEGKAEKIILFKWNRKYPADVYFDIDISSWRLADMQEFPGSSHEKITQEVYER